MEFFVFQIFFWLPLVRSLCTVKMSVIYLTYILALGILQMAIRSPLSSLTLPLWRLSRSISPLLLTISWVFSILAVEITGCFVPHFFQRSCSNTEYRSVPCTSITPFLWISSFRKQFFWKKWQCLTSTLVEGFSLWESLLHHFLHWTWNVFRTRCKNSEIKRL